MGYPISWSGGSGFPQSLLQGNLYWLTIGTAIFFVFGVALVMIGMAQGRRNSARSLGAGFLVMVLAMLSVDIFMAFFTIQ
jgi:hypothetical protein